jgi:hypothetical protein
MSPLSDLEDKFRSRGLEPEDREPLLLSIKTELDPTRLASALYIWGYTFPEEPTVRAACISYLKQPIPGVTHICLKVLCDFWGQWQRYEEELARYLDPDIYSDWYDEVIVAFSFVTRHPYGWSAQTLARYANVEREAKRLGLTDFI